MAHMIQMRNVPSHLHRALKLRAAMQGKSMSEASAPHQSSQNPTSASPYNKAIKPAAAR